MKIGLIPALAGMIILFAVQHQTSCSHPVKGKIQQYQRRLKTSGAKTVSLEIVLNRSRNFEFLVSPADVAASKERILKEQFGK